MSFEILRLPLDLNLEEASREIEAAQDRVGGGRHAIVLGLDGFAEALQVYVTDVDRGELPAQLAHHFVGRQAA